MRRPRACRCGSSAAHAPGRVTTKVEPEQDDRSSRHGCITVTGTRADNWGDGARSVSLRGRGERSGRQVWLRSRMTSAKSIQPLPVQSKAECVLLRRPRHPVAQDGVSEVGQRVAVQVAAGSSPSVSEAIAVFRGGGNQRRFAHRRTPLERTKAEHRMSGTTAVARCRALTRKIHRILTH